MILRDRPALWVVAVLLMFSTMTQAKTVTLCAADNRTDVFLNLGDTLVVELSSEHAGVFRWIPHLPKPSTLTALNGNNLPPDKNAGVPSQITRFRFNAATVGDTTVVFGWETEMKTPGAAPQGTSAYSVHVHVALGSPQLGTAVLYGVYKGTMPCADCSGLDTVLRLYAKGKFNTRDAFYIRTQTYRGAQHGDVVLSDRGEWWLLRGDATNPDATVYQLVPDDEQHSESWLEKDQGAALMQLDHEQKPIDSKMNLTLRRVNQSQ
jgi:uncharacterized lipoprotein NlpE involved in copper resistance